MNLFQHRDFEQTVLRAAEHCQGQGLRPAIVGKDYYVTEGLRIIVATDGDKVIFKGETSLSKGWNLSRGVHRRKDTLLDEINRRVQQQIFCEEVFTFC